MPGISWAAISLVGFAGPQQAAALEDPLWSRIRTSVLTLTQADQPVGTAVRISEGGLFLAFADPSLGTSIFGEGPGGQKVTVRLVKTDVTTQLSLLRVDDPWAAVGAPAILAVAPVAGSRLIAATAKGPVRGQLVSAERVGVLAETRRFAPLSEVRLESGVAPVGGAVVFDDAGRLVGVLGATLSLAAPPHRLPSGEAGNPGRAIDISDRAKKAVPGRFGPEGVTVAYSLAPNVLRRVVEGFLSPDHVVRHPSVGLLFTSEGRSGALVEAVTPGSPAQSAGVRVGDFVVEADGQAIRDAASFASVLFRLEIGASLKLVVVRESSRLGLEVTVGAQESLD